MKRMEVPKNESKSDPGDRFEKNEKCNNAMALPLPLASQLMPYRVTLHIIYIYKYVYL